MIAPRVSKHEKSGKYESGANGQSEERASSRLTRPKSADERRLRHTNSVLFYSKEMEPLARKVADASDQMVELDRSIGEHFRMDFRICSSTTRRRATATSYF